MSNPVREKRMTSVITGALAVVILIPSMFGFGSKLVEFITLVRGDVEGSFAISPVANYLLASLGFLFLLLWATANGMFKDIEEPKQSLLIQEQNLNREEPWNTSRQFSCEAPWS
jgi:nitrogen fixation-related uncharacterized protein